MNHIEMAYFDKKFEELHNVVLTNKRDLMWHLRIGSWVITFFGGALAFLYHRVLGGS